MHSSTQTSDGLLVLHADSQAIKLVHPEWNSEQIGQYMTSVRQRVSLYISERKPVIFTRYKNDSFGELILLENLPELDVVGCKFSVDNSSNILPKKPPEVLQRQVEAVKERIAFYNIKVLEIIGGSKKYSLQSLMPLLKGNRDNQHNMPELTLLENQDLLF